MFNFFLLFFCSSLYAAVVFSHFNFASPRILEADQIWGVGFPILLTHCYEVYFIIFWHASRVWVGKEIVGLAGDVVPSV